MHLRELAPIPLDRLVMSKTGIMLHKMPRLLGLSLQGVDYIFLLTFSKTFALNKFCSVIEFGLSSDAIVL